MKETFKVEDVIFTTREEAEEVRFKLKELAREYGSVRVSDLYDIAGLDCSYLMDKYGWFPHCLRGVNVLRVRDGYVLDLPLASIMGSPKITYRPYKKNTVHNKTKEPITITINTDDIKDFDSVLAETFKYVYTITDRPVYISII